MDSFLAIEDPDNPILLVNMVQMRFVLLSVLASGAAALAPRATSTSETVNIGDLTVRTPYGSNIVATVYFHLNGTDATNVVCSATDPGLNWTVFGCDESKYSFALGSGTKETYALRIYHQTGTAYVLRLATGSDWK